MIRATARALLSLVITLYIVSLVVFILVYLLGDPTALLLPDDATPAQREILRKALGLDQPWWVQYANYMRNVVTGDFGTSYRYGTDALPVVLQRLPATLLLTAAALLISLAVGIPVGLIAAVRPNSWVDVLVSGLTVGAKSMPNFWVGIMLILVFAVGLRWLPVSGSGGLQYLVLPALTLGTAFAAEVAKVIRSNMQEALSQDYVRTAVSRGVPRSRIYLKHAFRNSLLGLTAVTSLQVIGLIGGALVTETVFAWPGIGLLLVQSIGVKDMAVVQIAVFAIALLTMVITTATDLLYRRIDPRISS